MKRRIFVPFGLALLLVLPAAAAAAAAGSVSAAERAVITDVQLFRDRTGPDRGALVVTARADLTAHAGDIRRHGDATARLTIRLSDGTHRAVGADRVTLGRAHAMGTPAYFYIVIPARQAHLLNTKRGLTWTARLERTRRAKSRSMRPRFFAGIPSICGLMMLSRATPRFGGCGGSTPPSPAPPPPPAPPVGFSSLVYTDDYGDYQSLMLCVYFGGPYYRSPFIGYLEFNDTIPDTNNNAYVNSDGSGRQAYPIAADGSFAFGGTYSWYVGGPTNAVSITGTVPAAILSAAPNASIGPATATYAPAQQSVPTTLTATFDSALPQHLSSLC